MSEITEQEHKFIDELKNKNARSFDPIGSDFAARLEAAARTFDPECQAYVFLSTEGTNVNGYIETADDLHKISLGAGHTAYFDYDIILEMLRDIMTTKKSNGAEKAVKVTK